MATHTTTKAAGEANYLEIKRLCDLGITDTKSLMAMTGLANWTVNKHKHRALGTPIKHRDVTVPADPMTGQIQSYRMTSRGRHTCAHARATMREDYTDQDLLRVRISGAVDVDRRAEVCPWLTRNRVNTATSPISG